MAAELQNCPECGNAYLAVRTDVYKDGREFVYCDCCGCLADRRVWNRITPLGVPPTRALCKLCGTDAGNNPHGPGVCVTAGVAIPDGGQR